MGTSSPSTRIPLPDRSMSFMERLRQNQKSSLRSRNKVTGQSNPSAPALRYTNPEINSEVSSNLLPDISSDLPPSYNLAPVTAQDGRFAFLRSLDTVFLIDDSWSIVGRPWRQIAATFEAIPLHTCPPDGVDNLKICSLSTRVGYQRPRNSTRHPENADYPIENLRLASFPSNDEGLAIDRSFDSLHSQLLLQNEEESVGLENKLLTLKEDDGKRGQKQMNMYREKESSRKMLNYRKNIVDMIHHTLEREELMLRRNNAVLIIQPSYGPFTVARCHGNNNNTELSGVMIDEDRLATMPAILELREAYKPTGDSLEAILHRHRLAKRHSPASWALTKLEEGQVLLDCAAEEIALIVGRYLWQTRGNTWAAIKAPWLNVCIAFIQFVEWLNVSIGASSGLTTIRDAQQVIDQRFRKLSSSGFRSKANRVLIRRFSKPKTSSTTWLNYVLPLAFFAPVVRANPISSSENNLGGSTSINFDTSSPISDWGHLFGKRPLGIDGLAFVVFGIAFMLIVHCLIATRRLARIGSLRWIMGVTAYWSAAVLVRKDSPTAMVFTLLLLYAWSTGNLGYAEFELHQLDSQFALPIVLIALMLDILITSWLSRRAEDLIAFFPPALSCSLIGFTLANAKLYQQRHLDSSEAVI